MQVTTKVRLRGIDAAEFRAQCAEEYRLASAARAVAVMPNVGSESAVSRPITICGPTASRVTTSITPPGPPGPSIGEAGVVATRICTMSVTGIVETSNVP